MDLVDPSQRTPACSSTSDLNPFLQSLAGLLGGVVSRLDPNPGQIKRGRGRGRFPKGNLGRGEVASDGKFGNWRV